MRPVCPECGSKRSAVVKTDSMIPDRKCNDCGVVFAPRIPAWLGYLLYGTALLLGVYGIMSFFFDDSGDRLVIMGIPLHMGFFFIIMAAPVAVFGYVILKRDAEQKTEPGD